MQLLFSLDMVCVFSSYFSGREAISVSRREQVRKGLHTVAYDDTEQHRMLACFGPDGRNCCYYPNGSIQMLTSECGGSLFDEVGRGGGRVFIVFGC